MNQRQQLEQKLIENPCAAIEAVTGMKIPEKIKIKVLEEDPQTVYLVLPFIHSVDNEMELSEAELESVAGGNDIWTQPAAPVNQGSDARAVICT